MAKKLNQKQKVLRHLQEQGSINPHQALFDYSIMRLAAVIFDLKEEGHDIVTELVRSTNKFKEPVTYAKYRLANKKIVRPNKKEDNSDNTLQNLFESFTKIF